MAMVRVNLTMFKKPVEVDDTELPTLRAQGLLIGVAGDSAEQPDAGGQDTSGQPDTSGQSGGDDAAKAAGESSEAAAGARRRSQRGSGGSQ